MGVMKLAKNSGQVDWKRNNKIGLRNFSEACDFHDLVKLILVKMLRRAHRNSILTPIYTEHNPDNENENYPDICMVMNGRKYVWEIQESITTQWTNQIIKQHEDADLIIVPLQVISRVLNKRITNRVETNKSFNILLELRTILKDYVI